LNLIACRGRMAWMCNGHPTVKTWAPISNWVTTRAADMTMSTSAQRKNIWQVVTLNLPCALLGRSIQAQ
jgi:hypothetical protein